MPAGSPSAIGYERARVALVRRRPLTVTVRAQAIAKQRFGYDVDAQPTHQRLGKERPVLDQARAALLVERSRLEERFAANQHVGVAHAVDEQRQWQRAAQRHPSVRRVGIPVDEGVVAAGQNGGPGMLCRADQDLDLGREREIVVVHEQQIVATRVSGCGVSRGAGEALRLAQERPGAAGEIARHGLQVRLAPAPSRCRRRPGSLRRRRTTDARSMRAPGSGTPAGRAWPCTR